MDGLSSKKRPTMQTFRQFVELARPEAPAFLTALGAVAVVREGLRVCDRSVGHTPI